MGDFCSGIVVKCGGSWTSIGWGLFAAFMFVPMIAQQPVLWLVLLPLWLLWWIIDAVDQQIPGWVFAVGAVMVLFVFLPRGWLITVAAWVIYCIRVRE